MLWNGTGDYSVSKMKRRS